MGATGHVGAGQIAVSGSRGDHLKFKTITHATAAIAVVALITMTAPAADAAAQPTTSGTTSITGTSSAKTNAVHPQDVWCNFKAVQPWQLVQGSTTYGRGLTDLC